ncbi:nucleotidyltransferase domain-containing protein [Microbacterium paludicola]|uniref:Nucleotidyltransferase domain-containing protein n=1 Tax=Microbacterium paludicola TaxID=300019 RepID=A0A4Y9FW31_9MICO|nr:nucleotidyltransferase domain-containing protein [Microbacterium paludicola]MBF0815891.1 nucleotidyltransferase domain-containing protein [Microbacterium paludicola]TFU33531.1 nucleotidyltransferase domain-containing protein [Microbacterium paludicola]
MDHAEIARRFVEREYPQAEAVVLAGSTARGERTPTSDVDLLVIGPAEMFGPGEDSRAATYAFGGEVFEVFAYTPDAFTRWVERGLADHRPLLLNMLIDGLPVRAGALLESLRARWAPVRDAGPQVDPHELEVRRYIVTDVLDDLRDATDSLERHVLAALLFERLGQLLLLDAGRWLATGKHLPRCLRAWDPDRTARLADPLLEGDDAAFLAAAEAELEALGGRLQAGFTR